MVKVFFNTWEGEILKICSLKKCSEVPVRNINELNYKVHYHFSHDSYESNVINFFFLLFESSFMKNFKIYSVPKCVLKNSIILQTNTLKVFRKYPVSRVYVCTDCMFTSKLVSYLFRGYRRRSRTTTSDNSQ